MRIKKIIHDIKAKLSKVYHHSPFLEVSVSEHCNLNCKGCAHYAPLATKKYLDIDRYKADMKQLTSVEGIDSYFKAIQLMGGEPLLNPGLIEICKITRQFFPNTRINVVTNGILVKKMPTELWNCLKELDIYLKVTKYPIAVDYTEIKEIAELNGVKYQFVSDGDSRQWMKFPLVEKTRMFASLRNFKNCHLFYGECLQYVPGKLVFCFFGAHSYYLNKEFGTNLHINRTDYLSICKIKSVKDVRRWRCIPHHFCKYCAVDKYEKVDFEVSKRIKREWFDL